jgi:hypothetical protein
MIRRLISVLLAGSLGLAGLLTLLPAAAGADALSKITAAYIKDGTVPICHFSVKTLGAAERESENAYNAEYLAAESDAIAAALTADEQGRCRSRKGLAAPKANPHIPAGTAGEPHSVTAATGSGIPAPIAILALGIAVLALAAGAAGFGRMRGWDPLWLADWRHASAEAGFRVGGAWAQLVDRLRPGRR